MTGNGNNEIRLKNLVKRHQVKPFLADFRHLEPQCKDREKTKLDTSRAK